MVPILDVSRATVGLVILALVHQRHIVQLEGAVRLIAAHLEPAGVHPPSRSSLVSTLVTEWSFWSFWNLG